MLSGQHPVAGRDKRRGYLGAAKVYGQDRQPFIFSRRHSKGNYNTKALKTGVGQESFKGETYKGKQDDF